MADKTYQLKYLPIFEQDLVETVGYITNVLKNPDAAARLLEDVETAIYERLQNPLSFEPYRSAKKRRHDYYRIYIRNYTVYYVVIDDIMEVKPCIGTRKKLWQYQPKGVSRASFFHSKVDLSSI